MHYINIDKPLYNQFVYISAKVLNDTIKAKDKLTITIPQGSAVVDPYTWKINAVKNSKVMKKVFNYPDNPMVLYGGTIPLPIELKTGQTEIDNPYVNSAGESLPF